MNVLDHTKAHQRFFEEMTRIPHGSFHERAYSVCAKASIRLCSR